jgi:DNA ligase 4
MIIDKGIHDIIRPQWIFDSIANNALAPMTRNYFFHATASRMESEEFNDEGDDLERHSSEGEAATRMSVSPDIQVDNQVPEFKEEDSEMQDWLQIGPSTKTAEKGDDDEADSATDPDSDNEDNWFSVEPPREAEVPGTEVSPPWFARVGTHFPAAFMTARCRR